MLVGMMTLAYVGFQYFGMWREQRSLEAQWQQQQRDYAQRGGTPTKVDDGLTRIEIPKIDLEAIVVNGSDRKHLKVGPGWMTNTAEPGARGNAVISAHRDTFFRHIYELGKGDEVLVRRNGQVFRYAVTGKKIVEPEDVSVLKQTDDPQLTLITCYPTYYIGPAPKRLVVFSKLLDAKPDTQMTASVAQSAVAGGH